MRQPEIAGDAVGELAEELPQRALERQLRAERQRAVTGNQRRTAVLPGKHAQLEAVRSEAGAVAETELERRAVCQHRLLHVLLRGPALHAVLGAHLEPISTPEQTIDAGIARRDVKHRIA